MTSKSTALVVTKRVDVADIEAKISTMPTSAVCDIVGELRSQDPTAGITLRPSGPKLYLHPQNETTTRTQRYEALVGDHEFDAAVRVVNLRKTLAYAQKMLRESGHTLIPACNELAQPQFQDGQAFWAEVRRVRAADRRG